MYIIIKMRTELHSRNIMDWKHIWTECDPVHTSPKTHPGWAERESIKHNEPLVYHHMEEAHKEQTPGEWKKPPENQAKKKNQEEKRKK